MLDATTHYVMNNWFKKSPSKKVTFKENINNFNDSWDPKEYAEIDFCLANNKSRNIITNVETNTKRHFNSDHFPLITTVRVKTKKAKLNTTEEKEIWKNQQKPDTDELVDDFYREIAEQINNNHDFENEDVNTQVEILNNAFRKIATEQNI